MLSCLLTACNSCILLMPNGRLTLTGVIKTDSRFNPMHFDTSAYTGIAEALLHSSIAVIDVFFSQIPLQTDVNQPLCSANNDEIRIDNLLLLVLSSDAP